jgi:hypothetical protein
VPALPRVASCRSCLAGIRWVTLDTGSANPIDAEPSEDGNIVQLPDGRWHVLRGNEDPGDRTTYSSHFRTCPHAKEWRTREAERRTAPPNDGECTVCLGVLDPAVTVNPQRPAAPHVAHPTCDAGYRPVPEPGRRHGIAVLVAFDDLDPTPHWELAARRRQNR